MLLLTAAGKSFELVVEPDCFALVVVVQGFGPYLVTWEHVLLYVVCRLINAHLDDPETAVARVTLQESPLVGRGEEHALTAVGLAVPPICRAELVLLLADKGLERLHGALLIVLQLAHLDEPLAPQLLHGVFRPDVSRRERVTEPRTAELAHQRGLAKGLPAHQGEDVVILDARLHYAGHRRHEMLSRHRPRESIVRRSEPVAQQGVDTFDGVPLREAVKVIPDRMVGGLMHHGVEGVDECGLDHRRASIRLANPLDELVVVAVLPELVASRARPWSLALQDLVAREHVEPDKALDSRVVLEDEAVVCRGSHKPSLAVKLDAGLPALVLIGLAGVLRTAPGKVLHHGHALLREGDACPGVCLGHAAHGQI